MASPSPVVSPSSDHGYDIGGNLTSALVIGAAAILCTFALVVFYFVRYICLGRQLQLQRGEFRQSCTPGEENKALLLKELPVVSWSELLGKRRMKGDETCSVCLRDFGEAGAEDASSDAQLRLLPRCGHCFHCQCVDGWLNEHSLCPVCRGSWVIDLKAAAALLSGGSLEDLDSNSGVSSEVRGEVVEEQDEQGATDLESGRGLSLVGENDPEGSK